MIAFAILPGSVGFWIDRFIKHHIQFEHPKSRFDDERVITFEIEALLPNIRLPMEIPGPNA